ncbi:unnamed protein product [Blepharisma stoltei]|uniref:Uncharacterized protein n=1 Tax=Blepharisma stoltei TaxID=1481888 RepID=A0AAU9I8X5_9CILI|nr:unnamed protein product [Blepharisma stoltei]
MSDLPQLRERAYSSMAYHEYKKLRVYAPSPEIKPLDSAELPPPISLTPSAIESSIYSVETLLREQEEDQLLIKILKKTTYEQSMQIDKLQANINELKHTIDALKRQVREQSEGSPPRSTGFFQQAILARSRSNSTADAD